MEKFKTIDELTNAVKSWMWYDDDGDGHVPNDIAFDAIEQAVNITKNETKPLKQTDVSGLLHLPTKEEIIQTLYKCAKIDNADDGIKMERIFEKEAEAILSLITDNSRQ